jgi:hypothetical protein
MIDTIHNRCRLYVLRPVGAGTCTYAISHFSELGGFSFELLRPSMTHNDKRILDLARRIMKLNNVERDQLSNILSGKVRLEHHIVNYEVGRHQHSECNELSFIESSPFPSSGCDVLTSWSKAAVHTSRSAPKFIRRCHRIRPSTRNCV